jgi:protein gp37
MTDLFWDQVPDEWIDQVFAIMAICDGKRLRGNSGRRRLFNAAHAFQVLTKRAERMRRYLTDPETPYRIAAWVAKRYVGFRPVKGGCDWLPWSPWPLPQVWLGVSAENQATFDARVEHLGATPAAVRFVSLEPLLEAIDCGNAFDDPPEGSPYGRIDWAILGGESGPGARPMHPDWARRVRDQCQAAGTAYFFKQWGEWAPADAPAHAIPFDQFATSLRRSLAGQAPTVLALRPDGHALSPEDVITPDVAFLHRVGKKRAGATLDGREWREFPR